MDRRVICTNADGVGLEFNSRKYEPFLLNKVDGIYSYNINVSTSTNTMLDGDTYIGSAAKMRNIVLYITESGDHKDNRNMLYKLFKKGTPGTLRYIEGDEDRSIGYYVESVDIESMFSCRSGVISLLCPDPYFYDAVENHVDMAIWEGQFEFEHEFLEAGEEMGAKQGEKIKAIENPSDEPAGMTISLTADAAVTNPYIFCVETSQTMEVGYTAKTLSMVAGDQLIISTVTGAKNVFLVHEGVTTSVNEYISEDSEFLQLQPGVNTIRFGAATGEDYLQCSLFFRYRYEGC